MNLYDLSKNAHRVLWWYSILFFKLPPPIVVISVPERQSGHQYADVTSAVRSLVDDYGLSVLVDGSPNSIPPELLATNRETVITLEAMSREMLESIPEFQDLIHFLKSNGLDDGVWNVLGGNPAKYLDLERFKSRVTILSKSDTANDVIIEEVKAYIQSLLINTLNDIIANSSSNTEEIIKIFREKKVSRLPKSELKSSGYLVDYPNKVFCEVKRKDGKFVEPSTSAVALIINENIQDDPGVRALTEKLFQRGK